MSAEDTTQTEHAPLTVEEKIARAEERSRKQTEYAAQLRRIAVAEAEIPGAFNTGEVNKTKLAEKYGISTMTVNRILEAAGIKGHTIRRLTEEEKQDVIGLLKSGNDPAEIAEAYNVAKGTVRTLGVKAGVLEKGVRKPLRTDEEYELIAAFDREARERFGASLYNLGTGLRSFQARRARESAAPEQAAAPAAPAAEQAVAAREAAEQGTAPVAESGAPEVEWEAPATPNVSTPADAGTPAADQEREGDYTF